MLKSNGFSHNHHPPTMKMMAKNSRREISVYVDYLCSMRFSAEQKPGEV
jgi:hypothetical protein